MAAETEQVTILTIKTATEGANSVQDLKDNIKALKEIINQTTIGTKDYQDALRLLQVNQNALKDAMHATTQTGQDAEANLKALKDAASGTSETYNGLVHKMAQMKEAIRNVDVSTKEGMEQFRTMAEEIDGVNSRLKKMDELQGNYQRSVGNYQTAFKGLAEKTDAFSKAMDAAKGGANGLKNGFEAFGKSPAIATFGLLVRIVANLAENLKGNQTAMDAVKTAINSLQPVMDFFSGIVEKLAGFLADIIGKVAQFVSGSGLFDKVIKGVVGVGNAILQYILTPFKGVIAAIKVFQEEGVKGIGNAAKAFGKEVKSGFSFKQNFQAGQEVANTLIAGAKSKKEDVKKAGKEVAKDAKDGFLEELRTLPAELDKEMQAEFAAWEKEQDDANKTAQKGEDFQLKSLDKIYNHQLKLNGLLTEDEEERASNAYAIQEEANRKKLELLDKFAEDALNRNDLEAFLAYDQERADLEVEIEENALEEKERIRKKDNESAKKSAELRKKTIMSVAGATSSILSSIADMYEADEENSEKNAEKIKAIRIATATMDTIMGAVGAFMQAADTLPPPFGAIVGAAQAAVITAAGMAQIAQLRNTQVSANAGTSSAPVSAIASAPAITPQVSNVRNVTSASEEDRLNRMASDQRVYILSSDIEASQRQIRTQVSESSF